MGTGMEVVDGMQDNSKWVGHMSGDIMSTS